MNLRFESDTLGTVDVLHVRKSVLNGSLGIDPGLRSAFRARGAGKDNLERLFSENALCVTSGQQPGLLTGPLYTIYKALSAAALANQVEEKLGRPVVPVFWVAGDDHDFAEVNHCFVPSLAHQIVRLELRGRDSEAAMNPMYREMIGGDIEAVFEQLEEITPETEFRAGVLDWLRSHYMPEASMASAFETAMAELLGQFGVVVFSPTHNQAKRSMSRWIGIALNRAGELDRLLCDRASELKARAEPAPIPVGDGASTVFIDSVLGRDRLLIEGDAFRARRAKELWTLEALAELTRKDPARLSPNVLLRPVVEAAILPTVAYVAGPGELAYLPQASPLYSALDVEPQTPVPRWSGRVIENRTSKVLEKYEIDIADLALPEGQLTARVLQGQLPASAVEALCTLEESIHRGYSQIAEAAAGIDLALEKPILAAERGALRELSGVEKRITRILKQQNETTVRQIANARMNLLPLGKPQERVFNVTHFLIRYGTGFLSAIFDQCVSWADTLESISDGA